MLNQLKYHAGKQKKQTKPGFSFRILEGWGCNVTREYFESVLGYQILAGEFRALNREFSNLQCLMSTLNKPLWWHKENQHFKWCELFVCLMAVCPLHSGMMFLTSCKACLLVYNSTMRTHRFRLNSSLNWFQLVPETNKKRSIYNYPQKRAM